MVDVVHASGQAGGRTSRSPYYDGYVAGTTTSPISRPSRPRNWKIGSTNIGVLRCPDDNTIQVGQGNLSYVVNGGFSLWHAHPVRLGRDSQIDGQAAAIGSASLSKPGLQWTQTLPSSPLITIGITQKMGVMFLDSTLPQGSQSRIT